MTKKYDLTDLTFIIPLRIDSIDRLENLLCCTQYILTHFQTHITVWEADARNAMILPKLLHPDVKHQFQEDNDPIFYRTYYINQIIETIDTPYVAVWDADVIAPKEQIINSVKLLRENEADFVYPYRNVLLNVPPCVKKIYFKSYDMSVLTRFTSGLHAMYGPKAIGGGFMVNREKYIEAGMENENYYGWGLEDGERYHRWDRLGYRIEHVDGVMYHLDHSRGINSAFHSNDQRYIKTKEQHRIRNISPESLRAEVNSWAKGEHS